MLSRREFVGKEEVKMIEQIIYWVGVTAILLAAVTTILFCLWITLRGLNVLIWKELKDSYNLLQVNYFMGELKKKGRAWCIDDMNKNQDQDA